jgi:hypothetical protein
VSSPAKRAEALEDPDWVFKELERLISSNPCANIEKVAWEIAIRFLEKCLPELTESDIIADSDIVFVGWALFTFME